MKLLGQYKNGNYTTKIYSDGTKVRMTNDDEFIPEFAENMDVKITDKCSQGCAFCYEGCTIHGRHAKLMKGDGTPAQKWMEDLKPYTELAINGNDMDHPELVPFLKYMKSKKVITNITVNQNQFEKSCGYILDLYNKKLIHGVGVSLINPTDYFIVQAKSIPTIVIHTIAGVLTKEQLDKMSNHDLKLLILGYKDLRRGSKYLEDHGSEINENINMLASSLENVTSSFKVVSFDNLALEQLSVKENLFADKPEEWDTFYMGDDGTMTYYIDAVNETYSKNSCMPAEFRYSSKGLTSQEMFNKIVKEN
jgi:hypothetical protein